MKSLKGRVCVALLLLCTARVHAFTYTNQELGFTAVLPDGLDDMSKQVAVESLVSRGTVHAPKNGLIEYIIVQDLHGRLGREDLSKRINIPQNASLEKTKWKDFDIDLFRIIENVKSVSFLTLNAQVPLKPHAIQITVSGPAADESKLRNEMQKILASVDGPTNWTANGVETPREELMGAGLGLLILIGIIATVAKRFINGRANDEAEVAPSIASIPEPPKIIKRLITQCHMCQRSIPPDQQQIVSTCPSCGADLARAR